MQRRIRSLPPRRPWCSPRRGPFKRWLHEHLFEDRGGHTLAIDRVHYAVYGGWPMRSLLVDRDTARIFAFRTQALRTMFGAAPDA